MARRRREHEHALFASPAAAVAQRIRERAERERRSFANEVRVLLERQLDASRPDPHVDADEVERLAVLYDQTIGKEP